MAYKSFAGGYLIQNGKVLLVNSRKYNKWVPPGGHLEENETPDQAVVREFLEETGIKVVVVPNFSNGLLGDAERKVLPLPFHMGLFSEDFDVPHIGYFYFVKPVQDDFVPVHQESEHTAIGWFSSDELEKVPTYDQVRNEAAYAFEHYPKI